MGDEDEFISSTDLKNGLEKLTSSSGVEFFPRIAGLRVFGSDAEGFKKRLAVKNEADAKARDLGYDPAILLGAAQTAAAKVGLFGPDAVSRLAASLTHELRRNPQARCMPGAWLPALCAACQEAAGTLALVHVAEPRGPVAS